MKQNADYFVHQNVGAIDRTIRVVLGFAMLGVPYFQLLQPGAMIEYWQAVSMMISIYPCLTGILGYDPIYGLFSVKSCDTSNRNQCGSFPYQVDALLGHNPIPEDDQEHSLLHSKHPPRISK